MAGGFIVVCLFAFIKAGAVTVMVGIPRGKRIAQGSLTPNN